MNNDHFLGVDVGNTHTVVGLFAGGSIIGTWRISTRRDATCHEVAPLLSFYLSSHGLGFHHIKGIIRSSVVPPADELWNRLAENYLGTGCKDAHDVAEKIIAIRYPRPHEIGTDRLVNAIGAFNRYKRPCIVADFGTATTFDCISENGEYLGGAIAPGITMSLQALFSRTSKLPMVRIEYDEVKAIGKNTEEAIRSGVLYGFAGMADRIVTELGVEYQSRPVAVATGGLARLIFRFTKKLDYMAPELTMEGLGICINACFSGKDL